MLFAFFSHLWTRGISLPFLALLERTVPLFLVGAFVWWRAIDRRSATLLSAFFGIVAFTSILASSSFLALSPLFLATLAGAATFFCSFLATFPRDYAQVCVEVHPTWAKVQARVLRGLMSAACGIGILALLCGPFPALSAVVSMLALMISALSLSGCGICWTRAYRGTEAPRERQQLRLILVSTVLSLGLWSFLSVLRHLFPLLILSPFITNLPLVCLPLMLGYTFLRPQLFLLDRVMRQIACWFLRGLTLPLLIALSLAAGQAAFSTIPLARFWFLLATLTLFIPFLWWGTRALATWLFGQEVRELLRPVGPLPAPVSEEEAVLLLTSALSLVSGTKQLCLCFGLPDEQVLRPLPPLSQQERHVDRLALLQHAQSLWGLTLEAHEQARTLVHISPDLQAAFKTRALFFPQKGRPAPFFARWPRLVAALTSAAAETLLVPLHAQDRLCGLVIFGSRTDGLPYTGAEAEAILHIVQHSTPLLEQAHVAEEKNRQDFLLAQLYVRLATIPRTQAPNKTLHAYVDLAASLGISAEVWDAATSELVLRDGTGPWIRPEERLRLREQASEAVFFSSGQGFSCAVACFPLVSQHRRGQMILTYPHPHHFSRRDQTYLTVLAQHCQATLNVADHLYPRQASSSPSQCNEMVTLFTALSGWMDLALQENRPEATKQHDLQEAEKALQQLVELLRASM